MSYFNIYLSGGMTGMSMSDQAGWRHRMAYLLKHYSGVRYQVECFNPVAYYSESRPDEYDSEREVMEYDLFRLRTTDLVIVNFNNLKSLGTMAEIAIAYDRRLPIIGIFSGERGELHPWQEDMCSKIFDNEKDAAEYVGMYYLT